MKNKTIIVRDPKKGMYGTIVEDYKHIPGKKTLAIKPIDNRVWVSKFKRFYKDTKKKYFVHYDPKIKATNPHDVTEPLKIGDVIYCSWTRKISKTKSMIALLYDPFKKV